jgi:predicted RNA binding protein YcfA (HicA-like mRNA interferase family)
VTQFPAVSGKQLVAALKNFGFEVLRIKGSHYILRHPDGRRTVVPVHSGEDLGPGLMSKVLRDAQLTRDDLKPHL